MECISVYQVKECFILNVRKKRPIDADKIDFIFENATARGFLHCVTDLWWVHTRQRDRTQAI